eukprot:1014610-Pyramimonas_sp.AAC.1
MGILQESITFSKILQRSCRNQWGPTGSHRGPQGVLRDPAPAWTAKMASAGDQRRNLRKFSKKQAPAIGQV